MPRHIDKRISFDVPRDWEDRTMVAYAAAENSDGARANLVVTHTTLPDDHDLQSYARHQLDELADRLDGFVLRNSVNEELAGRPAIVHSFGCEGSEVALEQKLIMTQLPERVVVSVTLTAPRSDAAQLRPLFDRILSTMKIEAPTPQETS
jgi:hypothetical protein